ncbi:MAG: FkbM family methyltransferase [Verrucomicrobiota bacterium]
MIFHLIGKKPKKLKILRGPFKGATVYLNPSNSRRKLFGLYEHVLNDWIIKYSQGKGFVFDVGANTGYDTYGFAYLLSKGNKEKSTIVAFEPEAAQFPELVTPSTWDCYSESEIEIIEKFAGAEDNDSTTTLDRALEERPHLNQQQGLIKVDVEGAETEVMKGATHLLSRENVSWLIEIHGKDLIPEISAYFSSAGRPFLIKDLTPLPFVGAELREIDTYWLLTI